MIRTYEITKDEAQCIVDAVDCKRGAPLKSGDRFVNVPRFTDGLESPWQPLWRMLGKKYSFKEKDAYLLVKRRHYIVYAEPKWVIW